MSHPGPQVSQGAQQKSRLRTRFVLFDEQVSSEIHKQLRYILLERSLESHPSIKSKNVQSFTMPSRGIGQIITYIPETVRTKFGITFLNVPQQCWRDIKILLFMEDYFREYIASDEPINTKEKKFILGLHDLTVTWK